MLPELCSITFIVQHISHDSRKAMQLGLFSMALSVSGAACHRQCWGYAAWHAWYLCYHGHKSGKALLLPLREGSLHTQETPVCVPQVSEALQKNKFLTSLDLSCNRISDGGAEVSFPRATC